MKLIRRLEGNESMVIILIIALSLSAFLFLSNLQSKPSFSLLYDMTYSIFKRVNYLICYIIRTVFSI